MEHKAQINRRKVHAKIPQMWADNEIEIVGCLLQLIKYLQSVVHFNPFPAIQIAEWTSKQKFGLPKLHRLKINTMRCTSNAIGVEYTPRGEHQNCKFNK